MSKRAAEMLMRKHLKPHQPTWMRKDEPACKECLLHQAHNYGEIVTGHTRTYTFLESQDPKCSRYRFNGKETEPFEVE